MPMEHWLTLTSTRDCPGANFWCSGKPCSLDNAVSSHAGEGDAARGPVGGNEVVEPVDVLLSLPGSRVRDGASTASLA